MTLTNDDRTDRVRLLAWSASTTLVLLPLLTMKLADQRAWETEDLPFAFVMIAAVGLAFELALRVPTGWAYRAGAVLALGAAFLLTWSNLAVGFAGSENNATNTIFFAVPAVAFAGSLAVRFRSAGLAAAMGVAAAAQLTAGLVAWYAGYYTGPLTVTFTGLWLASSLSFRRFARARTTAQDAGLS